MAAEPRAGLLIDWGGVMTSNLMASFAAFCHAEGLDSAGPAPAAEASGSGAARAGRVFHALR